jgi:hypothetical protein
VKAPHIRRTIRGDFFKSRSAPMNTDHPAATLSVEELDHVSGGMKWDHNYVSKM